MTPECVEVYLEFGCSIDAAQQQMALNFELVVSRPAFLSSFSRLQVIQKKCPWCSVDEFW